MDTQKISLKDPSPKIIDQLVELLYSARGLPQGLTRHQSLVLIDYLTLLTQFVSEEAKHARVSGESDPKTLTDWAKTLEGLRTGTTTTIVANGHANPLLASQLLTPIKAIQDALV